MPAWFHALRVRAIDPGRRRQPVVGGARRCRITHVLPWRPRLRLRLAREIVSLLLRRPTFEWFAVTVMCMVIVVLAALEGWLWRIDQSIYDSTCRPSCGPPSSDVVIIAIDDASLASLAAGRGPGGSMRRSSTGPGRPARAMMMDLILDTPSRDDPEADQLLADAMRRYGQVVLPVVQATTGAAPHRRDPPAADLCRRGPRPSAMDHVEFDPDGVARSVYLWEGFLAPPGIRSWPSPCWRLVEPALQRAYAPVDDAQSTAASGCVPTGCASCFRGRRASIGIIPIGRAERPGSGRCPARQDPRRRRHRRRPG